MKEKRFFLFCCSYAISINIFFQALQEILYAITKAKHFPQRIVTMIALARKSVRYHILAPGGTTAATPPTWMVGILMVRSDRKEWAGITGRIAISLSKGPRWRYAHKSFKTKQLCCQPYSNISDSILVPTMLPIFVLPISTCLVCLFAFCLFVNSLLEAESYWCFNKSWKGLSKQIFQILFFYVLR